MQRLCLSFSGFSFGKIPTPYPQEYTWRCTPSQNREKKKAQHQKTQVSIISQNVLGQPTERDRKETMNRPYYCYFRIDQGHSENNKKFRGA